MRIKIKEICTIMHVHNTRRFITDIFLEKWQCSAPLEWPVFCFRYGIPKRGFKKRKETKKKKERVYFQEGRMWSYEPWHVMIYSSFCFSDFKFQSSNFTVTIKIRLMQIDYCALLLIRKKLHARIS